jgi:hypothetical protein
VGPRAGMGYTEKLIFLCYPNSNSDPSFLQTVANCAIAFTKGSDFLSVDTELKLFGYKNCQFRVE